MSGLFVAGLGAGTLVAIVTNLSGPSTSAVGALVSIGTGVGVITGGAIVTGRMGGESGCSVTGIDGAGVTII